MLEKMIYVLGCNRAGTTLLLNLFRCTKDTVIVNGEMPPSAMAHLKNIAEERCFKNMACKRAMGPSFGMNATQRSKALSIKGIDIDLKGVVRRNQSLWIDWLAMWNDVYYVHIRRDPRDCISSKLYGNYVNSFRMWKSAENMYEKLRELIPDKVILVVYEELVSDVNKVMDYVIEKVGLEKSTDFSYWHELIDAKEKEHPSMHWMRGAREIDNKSVGKWKNNIKRVKEQVAANKDFTELLLKYGYEKNDGWLSKI